MPIDINKPLEESKKEFTDKVNSINPEELGKVRLDLSDFKDILPDDSTSWWQIATQALPTLLNWRVHLKARKDGSNAPLPKLNIRDIFLAYLKEAVIQRTEVLGPKVPSNLKTKILNFLCNLADMMTRDKITSVAISQVEKNSPGWTTRFFGDPWQGKNETGLKLLNLIRSNAQDFIQCTEGKWRFILDDFIEKFDSINLVEMTNLESKLRSKMSNKEARNAAFNELANALFSETEGPYSLLKKQEMTQVQSYKP